MLRIILISVLVAVGLVAAGGAALYQYWGWKGLIVLPFGVIVLLWVVKKIIGKMMKRFFQGLFESKSKALHGATMEVHRITPVLKPLETQIADNQEDEEEPDSSDDEEQPEKPPHYFEVELTITPAETGEEHFWEPAELLLASERLESFTALTGEDKQVGRVHSVMVWNGNSFGPDDSGKYPGIQRLLATYEVNPGTSSAWLQYYNEPLGEIIFPAWTPTERAVVAS
jgi:hypothetical protein